MDSLTEYERDQTLLRAGLHEAEVAFIEPGTRRTLAHRLAKLEKVVEAARVICDDMKACRMPYASTMMALDTALAALESEVGGG